MRKEIILCDKCGEECNIDTGYYDIIPNFGCSKEGCCVLHLYPEPTVLCSRCYKR